MVTPLTRKKKNGEPYRRPREIEEAVEAAVLLPNETAIAWGMETDKTSLKFLRSECLVHLIREARRRNDQQTMNGLIAALFFRCDTKLNARHPDGYVVGASEIREEVLSRLGEYFALDGQEGDKQRLDFYEVRFNKAFRAMCVSEQRKVIRRTRGTVPLPESEHSGNRADDAKRSNTSEELAVPSDCLSHARINEALAAMAMKDRRAFLLVHQFGAKIESEDPNERTAAKIEDVSGREIRTRLARAREIYKRHTEDT